MPLLIRVLIGSLVSSIKVSLVRFTRKRFTIYKPNVSLEDRQADVSRGQGLFAFSIYTAYYRLLTATSISRNFRRKSNSIPTSRQLLRKVDSRFPVLSRKVDSDWSAVYISTCLHLSRVTNLHILTPNNSAFYASRIHD